MIQAYKIITSSQDSRCPRDLVLTLRFIGEAPDANEVICIVEDAPSLLEELEIILAELEKYQNTPHPQGCDGARDYLVKIMNAKHAIAKARGES